jgi:energy-coupling factor transporter ATP-binding protein EcfA2
MDMTTWTRPFPATLLDEPVEVRQKYFKDKIVAHRNIVEAHKQLMATLAHPIDGQIVMLIGAAGVGKTTIRKAMVRDLTAQFLAQTERHPSQIPVAGIELEAFHNGAFKWKKTRQMLLKALHEPAVDKKVNYHPRIKDNHGTLKIDNRVSVDDLGEILVEVLAYRKPRALWFDEGQHLIKVSGAKGLLNQLDVMKSLANRSAVVPVLFGTYEMNVLLGLSSQLDRRIHRIHVPRYKASEKQDVEEFQRVLLGFQKHLPFPDEPILLEHWAYFFEGSLGCVGLLKDWLYQAASAAFSSDEKTLTREQCDMWMKDCDIRVDMLHRMTMGETQFVKKHSQIELRVLLGLPYDDVPTPETDESSEPKRRNTKPGIRNPIRDKVGNHDHTF